MKTHPFTIIRAAGFKWLGLSTLSFLAACTGETVISSSEATSSMGMAPSSVASVPASSSLAAISSATQASSSSAAPVSEAFLRGQEVYDAQCAACHQDDGSGVSGVFPSVLVGDCKIAPDACRDVASLAGYVASAMPQPGKCTDLNGSSCATDVATYITQAFAPFVDETDSDGDGIDNADEVAFGSDPFDADTDGDGFSDPEELEAGTDPTRGRDYPGHRRPEGWTAGGSGCAQGASGSNHTPSELPLALLLFGVIGLAHRRRTSRDALAVFLVLAACIGVPSIASAQQNAGIEQAEPGS